MNSHVFVSGPTSADTLHRMLLTLQDDGVLYVYESVDEAVRDVEALDAEQTFRAVFDDTGQVYAIRWIRPNTKGRFTVRNGDYTLVPMNRTDVPALLDLLRDVQIIDPPAAKSRLQEIRHRLKT